MSERSGRPEHGVRWRNWARDQSCHPAQVARPRSVDELASAIVDARSRGWRVRAVGAGHSFSEIACTDGLHVRLDGLARVLDVDSDSGLVRTQAGVSIGELSRRLDQHGLAMENLGDIDSQSIAGAISTATHGTGARLRNIPAQVVEMTLVLADGSTLVCSSDRDDELFRAARVGLGALGVVAEVTLQCVPAFTLRGVDAPMPLDQTLDRFEQLALDNDHFEFYVFPYSRVALTRTNNRTDEPPRPRSRVNAYVDDVLLTNRAFGLACRAGRLMPGRIPQINRLVTRAAGRRVRVERSAAIFTSPRLVRFTEMEYSLPRERTLDAVRAVLAMIERDRVAVPFPIEVRTVAADDALLSTAAGRDSGFVAVHMFERMDWRAYFQAVEAIMDDLGGRPHWGKRHFQTADTLRPRYADWDRFQSVRARLDPEGRFANEWTDRVLGPAGDRAAWQSA
jgi:FAD-linked oxidoreductase